MSRRRGGLILYLVTWDADRIFKIGCSDSRRWRSFPDARLALALPFPDAISCYGFERSLHHAACRAWDRAFASGMDAERYLGGRGGGYLECYRATADEALQLIASQYDVTVRRHDTPSQCDVTGARTD